MYICYNCKTTTDELPTYEEHRGECHGTPSYERMTDNSCPCGHEYDEAVRCPICGDWKHEEDVEYGACDECVKDILTVENALEYIKEYSLEADFFVGWWFDTDVNGDANTKLVDLCSINWNEVYNYSYTQNIAKDSLFKFIKDELADFIEWHTGRDKE